MRVPADVRDDASPVTTAPLTVVSRPLRRAMAPVEVIRVSVCETSWPLSLDLLTPPLTGSPRPRIYVRVRVDGPDQFTVFFNADDGGMHDVAWFFHLLLP